MRIGISTSVIQRGKTGIAQYLFGLLRALREGTGGHEFFLFVLAEDLPFFEFAKGMQIISVPERFRSPGRDIWWHQTKLPALARSLRLDVLHVPSYRRLLWPKPCPLVATIHDLAPFHVAHKYDWKRMLYGRLVVHRLAHRQDGIIAVSRNTARDITKFFGIPPERVSVIHNGLDHERFFPDDPGRAREWAATRYQLHAPFFLYLARLEHPGKNHLRLINAFESFKIETCSPWQLVFGGSDWHGAEVIHQAIRCSRFASDIRCVGFVGDRDLPNLYRAAEVFVYPSLYEGFGLPPLEAMACGCPVLSSPRGSLQEIVGEAAMLVDPEDIAALKEYLLRLALSGSLRKQLRRAGLAHAACFTWARTAAQTSEVYQSIAEKMGRSRAS